MRTFITYVPKTKNYIMELYDLEVEGRIALVLTEEELLALEDQVKTAWLERDIAKQRPLVYQDVKNNR